MYLVKCVGQFVSWDPVSGNETFIALFFCAIGVETHSVP